MPDFLRSATRQAGRIRRSQSVTLCSRSRWTYAGPRRFSEHPGQASLSRRFVRAVDIMLNSLQLTGFAPLSSDRVFP